MAKADEEHRELDEEGEDEEGRTLRDLMDEFIDRQSSLQKMLREKPGMLKDQCGSILVNDIMPTVAELMFLVADLGTELEALQDDYAEEAALRAGLDLRVFIEQVVALINAARGKVEGFNLDALLQSCDMILANLPLLEGEPEEKAEPAAQASPEKPEVANGRPA